MGKSPDNPTATLYGNFKCPFTKEFVNSVLPTIVDELVQTDKLNFRFRTISYDPYGRGTTHGTSGGFISSSDPEISATALGVWEEDPDSYWTFFEDMFAGDLVSGSVTPSSLEGRMSQAGVSNISEVVAAAENGKYDSLVKDSHSESESLKIPHTPTLEIGGQTVVGPQKNGAQNTIDFITANLSSAATYKPKQDSEEVTKGSTSSSGSSTNTITLDGSDVQGWADYQLTVSGEFEQSRAMDSSLEDSDTIDGSTATGGLGPWEDTYTYTGEVTDLVVTQPITVVKNGSEVSLDDIGATVSSNTIEAKSAPAQDTSTATEDAVSGVCGRR